jgi:hypothetical protein
VGSNHKTFRAFIEDYIFKWRPNEVKYGQDWRVDKPITLCLGDGTSAVKKPNTRAAWYNVQQPMYDFFEVSFAEGMANGLSIKDTIEQGEQIYRSAIKSNKQEQPALQDVKRKFVATLQNMGIRGDRACVGARAFILHDEVTDALTTLCNRDTPIGEDTPLQDDPIHETTEEIDINH